MCFEDGVSKSVFSDYHLASIFWSVFFSILKQKTWNSYLVELNNFENTWFLTSRVHWNSVNQFFLAFAWYFILLIHSSINTLITFWKQAIRSTEHKINKVHEHIINYSYNIFIPWKLNQFKSIHMFKTFSFRIFFFYDLRWLTSI